MPVVYRFSTDVEPRRLKRMLIPEAADELLRGEAYTQAQIDWCHQSQQEAIAFEAAREGQTVTDVWCERISEAEAGDVGHTGERVAAPVLSVDLSDAVKRGAAVKR